MIQVKCVDCSCSTSDCEEANLQKNVQTVPGINVVAIMLL